MGQLLKVKVLGLLEDIELHRQLRALHHLVLEALPQSTACNPTSFYCLKKERERDWPYLVDVHHPRAHELVSQVNPKVKVLRARDQGVDELDGRRLQHSKPVAVGSNIAFRANGADSKPRVS